MSKRSTGITKIFSLWIGVASVSLCFSLQNSAAQSLSLQSAPNQSLSTQSTLGQRGFASIPAEPASGLFGLCGLPIILAATTFSVHEVALLLPRHLFGPGADEITIYIPGANDDFQLNLLSTPMAAGDLFVLDQEHESILSAYYEQYYSFVVPLVMNTPEGMSFYGEILEYSQYCNGHQSFDVFLELCPEGDGSEASIVCPEGDPHATFTGNSFDPLESQAPMIDYNSSDNPVAFGEAPGGCSASPNKSTGTSLILLFGLMISLILILRKKGIGTC